MIFDHAFVLNLVREFTRNREFLHPTITHFASSFVYLQYMFPCHYEVKEMVIYNECCNCPFGIGQDGKTILKPVYTSYFVKEWRKCGQLVNLW